MALQKITPFLWFDHQAEEAAGYYASIFPNSTIVKVFRYSEAGPGPAGSAMTVQFQLEGQTYVALGRLSVTQGRAAEAGERLKNAAAVLKVGLEKDPDNVHHRRALDQAEREVAPR